NAVVRCDDQHHQVGEVGATGAHAGECFVAGRIEEHHGLFLAIAAGDGDAVSTDVLGDAARFVGCDILLADAVEQAGFAVVDVAEHRDHRGPTTDVNLD